MDKIPFPIKKKRITVNPTEEKNSNLIEDKSILLGKKRNKNPIPKLKFAKLLPITFPKAILGYPFKTELNDIKSSGNEVPNPIIKKEAENWDKW